MAVAAVVVVGIIHYALLCLRNLCRYADGAGVSHVIVDEVHERSIDSDFLLIILRELLGRRSVTSPLHEASPLHKTSLLNETSLLT
jgi:hypothetical protein